MGADSGVGMDEVGTANRQVAASSRQKSGVGSHFELSTHPLSFQRFGRKLSTKYTWVYLEIHLSVPHGRAGLPLDTLGCTSR